MSIDYFSKSKEVIAILEHEGYSERTITRHRRSYSMLWKHLTTENKPFTMDTAVDWLESKKPTWKTDTYARHRLALYRLEKYFRCGDISDDPYCGHNRFAYHDADVAFIKLPDNYKLLLREFHEYALTLLAQETADTYAVACADFLLFIFEKDCKSPREMSAELPLSYLQRLRNATWSDETKSKYADGVGKFFAFLSQKGHIPRCYERAMGTLWDENAIKSLKQNVENDMMADFQPSKALELHIDSFLLSLRELRYNAPQLYLYQYTFDSFCLFLEVNHIAYSKEAVDHWLTLIPRNTQWETKRKMIAWFADYLETGTVERATNFLWQPLLMDSLPDWSRKLIENYMANRQMEGLKLTSIKLIRSSCVRFFRFIESKKVNDAHSITPALVKEFHDTDPHETPLGANAYGVRVRGLLKYMGEENLVPKNLYLAVSAQNAPRRNIASVMCEDMISAVYSYRERAQTPLELRNIAMVMLGLRMGIRASDIVNLKIGDFDWKSGKLAFIQQKTNKVIALSILTDVGNSVYKYITQGRPISGTNGKGFVFVQDKSPYTNLSRTACTCALTQILSENGLALPHGQGFHITRRTFATSLLRVGTKVDTIVDALGHTSRDTINDYLAHDDEGMSLCPLPFGMIGGAQ